ncbi:MAG: hypothetical protein KJO05_08150 [Bacteroidia bacterium]|nr:hypothetical protein [Bacteroidia bacterium]NNF31512.1 hypothetical protein [Flavobacteriaceae bacterium]MBT8275587.1 hypothetical protein [Bacteroidia bacterium]NNJ82777.1 hypothetical protein [Flavobacteriaceae bacterium]NNK54091.1 hypothetical protein [Flavobacteriaceae bacterium]
MAQNNQEEVDLFVVLQRLNKLYHRFLSGIYKGIRFIIKNWIVLTILIVGGYFLGGVWKTSLPSTKESVLIVQNNFDSSNYVYNAVELLNMKYSQRDSNFLSKHNFDTEEPDLFSIEIEAIVNIFELLEKQETNDRNLESYLSRVGFEEDPLISELYTPEYRYHRITIHTHKASLQTPKKVLDYLNSNEIYNKTREVVVEETRLRIQRNDTSIKYIDDVFIELAGKNDQDDKQTGEVNFKVQQHDNLHHLMEKKREIIEENEMLKKELIKYDNVVTLINEPYFYGKTSFLDKKKIILPVLLVFLYVGFFVVRNMYRKGRMYSKQEE